MRKSSAPHLLLGIGMLLAFAASGCGSGKQAKPAESDALVEVTRRGPVEASVAVTPKAPSLADEITLTIRITAPEEAVMDFPEFGAQPRRFMIRRHHTLPLRISDKQAIRTKEYVLETLTSGEFTIDPLTIKFKLEGEDYTLKTAPLTFKVRSLATEELQDIHDIQPVTPLPQAGSKLWPWLSAAIALLLLVVGFMYLKRRRKPSTDEPQASPEELALQALRKLLAEGYIEQEDYRAFYFEITMIVRRYIERRFDIHAPAQTTQEFLREMAAASAFDEALRRSLQEFLTAADEVKYAARTPTREAIETTFATAKSVVGITSQETSYDIS